MDPRLHAVAMNLNGDEPSGMRKLLADGIEATYEEMKGKASPKKSLRGCFLGVSQQLTSS